jgi:hypothetical protein
MRNPALSLLAGLALLLFAAPAYVHHSNAPFDMEKVTTITGIVREFNWTNPHSSFMVEVSKPDGTTEIWAVEMNSPGNLVRQGWKRSTLPIGATVTVTLHPLRDGRPGGWFLAVDLPDGRHLGT